MMRGNVRRGLLLAEKLRAGDVPPSLLTRKSVPLNNGPTHQKSACLPLRGHAATDG